ncbi:MULTISPECIES: O-antigen ligase [unclassified Thioalkalivibrio]|uniref:O-antigen ligase family protein n=1 Tax=unclassified Thioalkalivibrio TaxID=2621013 RepID=UPI00036EB001|nr:MULTISPECIES: O-antigen ligase family protein [unclassified Thioalkalivibrio]
MDGVVGQRDWRLVSVVGLVALAFFLLPFGTGVFVPLAILALAGMGLLVTHLGALWRDRWVRWALVLLLALWVPQLLALTVAVDFDRAMRTAMTYPLFAISIIPLLWVARRCDLTNTLLYAVLALAVFWSLDGILQFLSGSNIFGYPYDGRRIDGLFHPNMRLGIVLAHLLPFVLEASRRLSSSNRLAAFLPLVVVIAILLSGSRASMLAAVITLSAYGVFLVWFYRLRVRTIFALLAALALGVAAALWASPETRDRLGVISGMADLSVEGLDAATAQRGTIWLASWRVVKDEPLLGVGVRGVEPVAKERGYADMPFSHVHLYFLDVWVSTGLVGLVAYLTALLGVLLALWRNARATEVNVPLLVTAGVAIFSALNPVNVHWTVYSSYTAAVLWLVLALALAPLIHGNHREVVRGRPS